MMEKTKIDFIADLLSSKKLDTYHKERFFSLAAQEIKKMETTDEMIWKEIEGLKTELGKVAKKEIGTEGIEKRKLEKEIGKKPYQLPTSHEPKLTYQLLSKFESSNGLKYLTHAFDDPSNEFNYYETIKIAKEEFEEYDNSNIPPQIRERIRQFAFDERAGWFAKINGKNEKYTIGWSSPEIITWCNNPLNKGKHPIEFPEYENKFINPFKQSIQIRDGQLPIIFERVISKVFDNNFYKKQIVFDNTLKGIKLFTNVEAIESGIKFLFITMKDYLTDSSRIIITAKRNEIINNTRFRVIAITHVNSISNKMSNDDILGGNLLDAKDRFMGLCNWSVQAKFEDGFFEKRILNDIYSTELEKIENVDGFSHQLYFYA